MLSRSQKSLLYGLFALSNLVAAVAAVTTCSDNVAPTIGDDTTVSNPRAPPPPVSTDD